MDDNIRRQPPRARCCTTSLTSTSHPGAFAEKSKPNMCLAFSHFMTCFGDVFECSQRGSRVFADILSTYFHHWGSNSGQLLMINATTANRIVVALRSGSLALAKLRHPLAGDELDQSQEEVWPVVGDLPIQVSRRAAALIQCA